MIFEKEPANKAHAHISILYICRAQQDSALSSVRIKQVKNSIDKRKMRGQSFRRYIALPSLYNTFFHHFFFWLKAHLAHI